jgi:hypothetical protein
MEVILSMPTLGKYENSAHRQAAYRSRCKLRGEQTPILPATGAVYRRWEKMQKQALSLLNQVTVEMEIHNGQRSETWQDSQRGEAFMELMESMVETVEALKEMSMHLPDA